MEMEVIRADHSVEFDFNSARSSPHVSTPSTPKRFGEYYCSAPSSPSHLSQFYTDFDDFLVNSGVDSAYNKIEDDFAFDAGDESETASLSAEELFDGGRIKPLNAAHGTMARIMELASEKKHGISPSLSSSIISPRNKKQADHSSIKRTPECERGRERSINSSSSSRRETRSVSPLRVSQSPWELDEIQRKQHQQNTKNKSHRKWRLKDLFLFRSASEGRAADKDPLKKYTAAFWRSKENSSFRSVDSPGSGSRSRRGSISAHEVHYTVNRAVSEDLKKKTFLPYKQGIVGRLAFNPAVHAVANGFGFSRK